MIIIPDLYTIDSVFIIVLSSAKNHVPASMLPVLNILYWTSYGISIALIDAHFIFRYLVVSGDNNWTSTKPSKLLIWFLYPMIFGGLHGVGCRYFAGPTTETNQFLEEIIHNDSHINPTEFDGMGFYVYPKDENGIQQINWMSVYGLIENSVEVTFSGIIMCVFGMKCYKEIDKMNSKRRGSSKYQSVQKQLFLALVLQTIIPLLLMYFPSGFIIIFCNLNQGIELFGRCLCITIALYPVFDPLPNMFVIKSFRNGLLEMKVFHRFLLALSFILIVASTVESAKKLHSETSKPLCGLCVNIVKQLDEVLEHGGDVEAAVDKFCKEDVPSFMVDMCEKVIEKNLEFIIEKLKDHEAADKICTDIFLCRTPKQYYFLETEQ